VNLKEENRNLAEDLEGKDNLKEETFAVEILQAHVLEGMEALSANHLKQHATSAANNAPSRLDQQVESLYIAGSVSKKGTMKEQAAIQASLETWKRLMKNLTK